MEIIVVWVASLGVRGDLATAASFGVVFFVSQLKTFTPREVLGVVAAGIGTAAYFTPILAAWMVNYFYWFPKGVVGERAVALVWGLVGTLFLAGVVQLFQRWKRDPIKTIKELKP